MELNSQVATLQDEVKLLKGEIKAVLKEIRTAVLSQDNPFSADTTIPTSSRPTQFAEPDEEPARPKRVLEIPSVESIAIPTFGGAPAAQPMAAQAGGVAPAMPSLAPAPQGPPVQQPTLMPPPAAPVQPPAPMPSTAAPMQPPAPAVTNIIRYPGAPGQQSSPAGASRPVASQELDADETAELAAEIGEDAAVDEYEDAPATTERPAGQRQPARARQPERNDQQTWTLASVAGLAVWAEEALATLGPRRYRFVLKLAAFAELLPDEAREFLAELDNSGDDDPGDDVPVSVNECLVVLRQLDAIVHGERVIRLPRRRGARLRRVR